MYVELAKVSPSLMVEFTMLSPTLTTDASISFMTTLLLTTGMSTVTVTSKTV